MPFSHATFNSGAGSPILSVIADDCPKLYAAKHIADSVKKNFFMLVHLKERLTKFLSASDGDYYYLIT